MATQYSSAAEVAQQLGADRVLAPRGALPQRAESLDASGPARPWEFEVAAERLCLDSTSHRQIRESCDGDPGRMAGRIAEIVAERGKMHNPETDSGGVLVGTVAEVGERFTDPPEPGDRVVTLSSMTLTPLRLDEIIGLDPDSPQVEVRGAAYVFERGFWADLPTDLPLRTALEVLDVCSAANQTRELTPDGGNVCVLGAGHAGKLAMAAARDAGAGSVAALDVDDEALRTATDLGLCDFGVRADLRDPVASLEAARSAGVPEADLAVSVVNVSDCEPTAILLAADGGTALFFAMSTSFSGASLAGDGIGTKVNMVIGSGYTPDRGAYALDLVRGSDALRRAFGAVEAA